MEAQRITRVEGRAIPLRGADIDTDRIMPARYLRSITFEGLEEYVFVDDRAQARTAGTTHPFDRPEYAGASILVVNSNFGCGSSREHAPQGLYRWGIRAVVGESFSEIFFGNSTVIGLPCLTASAEDVERLMTTIERNPQVTVGVDLCAESCQVASSAGAFSIAVSMPPRVREALTTGAWDTTGMLLENYDQVNATAARLPYVNGFA